MKHKRQGQTGKGGEENGSKGSSCGNEDEDSTDGLHGKEGSDCGLRIKCETEAGISDSDAASDGSIGGSQCSVRLTGHHNSKTSNPVSSGNEEEDSATDEGSDLKGSDHDLNRLLPSPEQSLSSEEGEYHQHHLQQPPHHVSPQASGDTESTLFSHSQLSQLQAQIFAYRQLACNQPVPDWVMASCKGQQQQLQLTSQCNSPGQIGFDDGDSLYHWIPMSVESQLQLESSTHHADHSMLAFSVPGLCESQETLLDLPDS